MLSRGLSVLVSEPRLRLVSVSLLVTLAILSIRLLVYLYTGSLAVLADALHSVIDIVGNISAIAAILVSMRGPDREHMYGHEKAESLGTLVISGLLVAVFVMIIHESLERALSPEYYVDFTIWSSIMIALTMAMDFWRSRALSRGASRYGSTVLEADALHYTSDLYASSSVLGLSLFGSLYRGPLIKYIDMAVSITIAGYFTWAALRLARISVDELLDRASEDVIELFNKIASRHGVVVKRVRTRRAGPRVFLDAVVEVPPEVSLEDAHEIVDKIEGEMRSMVKRSIDIVIHMEPRDEVSTNIKKRIREIISRYSEVRGVHDIEVARGERGFHVRFHIEIDPGTSLREAEEIVNRIKREVSGSMPYITSLMIHVEPVCIEERSIRETITRIMSEDPELRSNLRITSLKIVATRDRVLVDITCRAPHNKSIGDIHRVVSRLEGVLREELGEKYLVTISVEPE